LRARSVGLRSRDRVRQAAQTNLLAQPSSATGHERLDQVLGLDTVIPSTSERIDGAVPPREHRYEIRPTWEIQP
jgi:hypothetical protein